MDQRQNQMKEIDRIVDDFTQSQSEILSRLHALKKQLDIARLAGYSPRYIEDLLNNIKVNCLIVFLHFTVFV